LHLGDVVAVWYYSLEKEYGQHRWPCFAEFINLHFGSPIHSNPLGELKELYCTAPTLWRITNGSFFHYFAVVGASLRNTR
jgi:hypothetical protein